MRSSMPNHPHYTRKGKLSPTELRAFRARLKSLQKQGLVRDDLTISSARPFNISGGKTLAEIVNKSFEPPKPTPVKLTKSNLLPAKKPIELRELPDSPVTHKTFTKALNDIEKDAPALNKLKKSDEYFTFRIYGNDSLIPFRDMESLLDYLNKYRNDKGAFHKPKWNTEVTGNIQIMRFTGSTAQWQDKRKTRKPKPDREKRAKKQAERRRRK